MQFLTPFADKFIEGSRQYVEKNYELATPLLNAVAEDNTHRAVECTFCCAVPNCASKLRYTFERRREGNMARIGYYKQKQV